MFSDCTKVDFFTMNMVTKLSSDDFSTNYQYDSSGRISFIHDEINDLTIEYLYDEYGRCVEKKSDFFDFIYQYEDSEVCKVEDKITRNWCEYEYDKQNRLIKEKYSNGLETFFEYNTFDQQTKMEVRNRIGVLLKAKYYHYDENARLEYAYDSEDNLWTYAYDKTGRLSKVTYPYSDEICSAARTEAVSCGLGIKTEKPSGAYISVEKENHSLLSQYSWFEEYEYSKTGSVKSVSNPFGKIIYEYDSKNRLTKKHGDNTNSQGIDYFWNEDDCLSSITSAFHRVEFTYGIKMRPTHIVETNLFSGDVKEFSYSYDPLGRRISESVNNETISFVYDALSYDIIAKTPVFSNGHVLIKDMDSLETAPSQYNFRWIDDSTYTPFGESRGIQKQIDFQEDKRPCTILSLFGQTAFINKMDGQFENGFETEFVVSDNKGKTIGTANKSGDFISLNECDIWGCENSGCKNLSFSYSIGKLSTEIQIFDLGARDYVPSMKSFSTSDKMRSSVNWFSYSSCDPVNFVDSSGFYKKSDTKSTKAKKQAKAAEIAMFDDIKCHETGESQGIYDIYDCADTSSNVDYLLDKAAGTEPKSAKQKKFSEDVDAGKISESKQDVQSKDYYSEGWEKDFRKTGGINDKNDPNVVGPGTVLVWKNNTEKDSWVSHTLTVLSCEYDENGNVIGIVYIEGHTGGGKTEVSYMNLKQYIANLYSLENWIGEFLGFYEIEPNNSDGCTK